MKGRPVAGRRPSALPVASRRPRLLCLALGVLTAAVSVWTVRGVIRARRYDACRAEHLAAGFPQDYAAALAELRVDHLAWRFEPVFVRDLRWEEVVAREATPGWNLVPESSWAPGRWAALGRANYTPYRAAGAKAYDSGAWYQASREAIAYFLDPRNFLNERDVFMFETLDYDEASQTRETVAATLAPSFMGGDARCDGGPRTFAEVVWDVGRRLGVNPVFLAARLAVEQGAGTPQAFGTIGDSLTALYTNESDRVGNASAWGAKYARLGAGTARVMARGRAAYNGCYNFFNFGATGSGLFEIRYNAWCEATSKETRERYLGPWDTQAKAIEGGALKIRERYLQGFRHTRYLQKFSVAAEAGPFRWKQYMQNIAAPLVEGRKSCAAYAAQDALDAPFLFLVPVYPEMPKSPSPDPAGGRSIYSSFR